MIDFFLLDIIKVIHFHNPLMKFAFIVLPSLPSLDSVTCFFLEAFTLVASLAAAYTRKIYKIEIL